MLTTVYFATNRALDGPVEDWTSYGTAIRTPSDPAAVTYAVAFVDNADLTADTAGAIQQIQDVRQGGFSQSVVDDLSAPAAFNREWFAQGTCREPIRPSSRSLGRRSAGCSIYRYRGAITCVTR